jgi:hypothetical protein
VDNKRRGHQRHFAFSTHDISGHTLIDQNKLCDILVTIFFL